MDSTYCYMNQAAEKIKRAARKFGSSVDPSEGSENLASFVCLLCWIWYSLVCHISVFRRHIHPPSSVQNISHDRKPKNYFGAWAETFKFFCALPDCTAGWAIDLPCYLSVRLRRFFIPRFYQVGREGNSVARNWISCNIQVISEGRTRYRLINK